MAIFVCYFIQMFLQDPQYIFEWKYIVKNRKNVVFDSPFIGHNLLVEDLLPLPGDPLLEPCVQHHVHHAAQRLLGLVLQQLLLTSNTNILPSIIFIPDQMWWCPPWRWPWWRPRSPGAWRGSPRPPAASPPWPPPGGTAAAGTSSSSWCAIRNTLSNTH